MQAIGKLVGHWRSLSSAVVLLAMAIAFGALPSRVEAQAIYYRSIPIGERAIGLGGAFSGVASDPSATYYNPAGITRGGRFELLGSFSSLVFTRKKVEDAFTSPPTDVTFTSRATLALPRFIGTVVRLGKKTFDNDHRFALGYSSLEVARDDLSTGSSLIEQAATVDLRINENYRARWYGVSFAGQVTEKSSLGFTIYLSEQKSFYGEDIGLSSGGVFDEQTGLRVGGASSTASSAISATAYHFVPRIGWLHRISPQWQIGVMLQTPGIPLSQKGDVLRRSTTDLPPREPTFFLFDGDGLKAKMPIPFELRAGFGFQINPETLLSFDASVDGPVRSGTVFDEPEQVATISRSLGVYYAPSKKRRWTPNAAIGAEHRFGKVVVAGGLFTNISAAPDVPATADVYTQDQINIYGAAVSVGVDTKGYRLTLGATGMFGKGDALAAVISDDTRVVSYSRTSASRSAVVLYIAGAVSVATKTAEVVGEKHRKKKKDKGEEDASADTDAGTDTGTDAGPDAGPDAGTEPDADPDGDN